MNRNLKDAFEKTVEEARAQMIDRRWNQAYALLERAHVLGQLYVWPHVLTHWLMLRVELGRRSPFAAWGQAVRIAFGAVGSAVGVVPVGNTGGSNVNMFQPMPIAPELRALMGDEDGR